MPQKSVEPLFIWAPVILTVPLEFNWTETFLAIAIGATVSKTFTITVAERELPLWSWTVNTTLLLPICEQLKAFWLKTILVMVQLSVLALSNNAGLIIAWPLADK